MNNKWIQYSIYFLFIVLLQGLVINHLGLGNYAYPMVYVLPLLILPFKMNFFITMGIAVILGFSVDTLSDTFGLHTSASLLIAYTRPSILKVIEPRDGYDTNLLPTIHDMGLTWYAAYVAFFLLIHHTWFFTLEVFRLDLTGLIVLKILVSSFLSFTLLLGLQFLLYKSSK